MGKASYPQHDRDTHGLPSPGLDAGERPPAARDRRLPALDAEIGLVGWAKALFAMPTIYRQRMMFRVVGTRSLSSGARLRDPLALPTLRSPAFLQARFR